MHLRPNLFYNIVASTIPTGPQPTMQMSVVSVAALVVFTVDAVLNGKAALAPSMETLLLLQRTLD